MYRYCFSASMLKNAVEITPVSSCFHHLSLKVSSTTGGNSGKIFVAYFANWFQWWPEPYKFMPSDIPADKITHLNYAFAMIHSSTFKIRHFEDNDVSNWGTGTWETPCSQQSEWCSKGLYEQVRRSKPAKIHQHLEFLQGCGPAKAQSKSDFPSPKGTI